MVLVCASKFSISVLSALVSCARTANAKAVNKAVTIHFRINNSSSFVIRNTWKSYRQAAVSSNAKWTGQIKEPCKWKRPMPFFAIQLAVQLSQLPIFKSSLPENSTRLAARTINLQIHSAPKFPRAFNRIK